MMIGIYKITNTQNNKAYIGASINIDKRFIEHRSTLRHDKHYNKHLQRAWNKYGEDWFEFECIEQCDREELYDREQHWMTEHESCKRDFGYNMTIHGEHPTSSEWTEERKKNLSEKHKEYWKDNTELIEYYRKINSGKNNPMYGTTRSHTQEAILKMQEEQKGEKNGNAKLNETQVKEIKQLLKDGELSQEKIGSMYGISQMMVSYIKTGKSWGHVQL